MITFLTEHYTRLTVLLSSPGPKPIVTKPPRPNRNQVSISSKNPISSKGRKEERFKMFPSSCPPTKFRWTARGSTWGSPPCSSRILSKTLLKSLSGSDRSFVSEVHYSHISQSILHQTKGAENTSSCVLTYLCYISGWLMLGFQFGNIRNITHFGSKIETDHVYEVKQHNRREGHPGGCLESRYVRYSCCICLSEY